jgi:spore cortex biosynthesis protein YabQ
MYNTVQGESTFFVMCIIVGVALAFLYDVIRISRRIVRVGIPVVNLEDIVFFITAAILMFYAAYTKNNGEIRWQGFLGGITGVSGYFLLLRNRVVDIGTKIAQWLIKAVIVVVKTVMWPICIFLRAIKKPIGVVIWYTSKKIMKIKRKKKSCENKVRMRIKTAILMARKK